MQGRRYIRGPMLCLSSVVVFLLCSEVIAKQVDETVHVAQTFPEEITYNVQDTTELPCPCRDSVSLGSRCDEWSYPRSLKLCGVSINATKLVMNRSRVDCIGSIVIEMADLERQYSFDKLSRLRGVIDWIFKDGLYYSYSIHKSVDDEQILSLFVCHCHNLRPDVVIDYIDNPAFLAELSDKYIRRKPSDESFQLPWVRRLSGNDEDRQLSFEGLHVVDHSVAIDDDIYPGTIVLITGVPVRNCYYDSASCEFRCALDNMGAAEDDLHILMPSGVEGLNDMKSQMDCESALARHLLSSSFDSLGLMADVKLMPMPRQVDGVQQKMAKLGEVPLVGVKVLSARVRTADGFVICEWR